MKSPSEAMLGTPVTEVRKFFGTLRNSICSVPAGHTWKDPARAEMFLISLYKRELVKENDRTDHLMKVLSIWEWLEYTQVPQWILKDLNLDRYIDGYNWKEMQRSLRPIQN